LVGDTFVCHIPNLDTAFDTNDQPSVINKMETLAIAKFCRLLRTQAGDGIVAPGISYPDDIPGANRHIPVIRRKRCAAGSKAMGQQLFEGFLIWFL